MREWHIHVAFSAYVEKGEDDEMAFFFWKFWYNSHVEMWMAASELITTCFDVD